jgi:hypothetical protein
MSAHIDIIQVYLTAMINTSESYSYHLILFENWNSDHTLIGNMIPHLFLIDERLILQVGIIPSAGDLNAAPGTIINA